MSDLFETFISAAAQQIGEDRPDALGQLRRIVECLGSERTAEIIKLALRLEKFGGTLIADGSRRRSPGGTFYVLARGCLTRSDRKYVWPVPYRPPTTEPPEDESEGSVQSLETGARTAGDTSAILHAPSTIVKETIKERVHHAKNPQRSPLVAR